MSNPEDTTVRITQFMARWLRLNVVGRDGDPGELARRLHAELDRAFPGSQPEIDDAIERLEVLLEEAEARAEPRLHH